MKNLIDEILEMADNGMPSELAVTLLEQKYSLDLVLLAMAMLALCAPEEPEEKRPRLIVIKGGACND